MDIRKGDIEFIVIALMVIAVGIGGLFLLPRTAKLHAAQHAKPTPDFVVLRRDILYDEAGIWVLQHKPTGVCYIAAQSTMFETSRAVCDHYTQTKDK